MEQIKNKITIHKDNDGRINLTLLNTILDAMHGAAFLGTYTMVVDDAEDLVLTPRE